MPKEQIKFLIGHSFVPLNYVSDIKTIFNEDEYKTEPLWLMTKAFMYGIIVGKQQDRARRKKSGVNAL